jgi:CRISPR/Cas system CSM-associated protein Csm3 (group 7 of RAMP superfamily)
MSKTITYQIEFFHYWHAGSGLSGGTDANLTVIKNQAGLPFIPGRTLKGLLREAAFFLNQLQPDLVDKIFLETIFGVGEDHIAPPQAEVSSQIIPAESTFKAGICYFSNAELSQFLSEKIPAAHRSQLYKVLASTAIDENGQAKNRSLRQMEVCIPLRLYATIEQFPDDAASLAKLEYCLQWVKKMGSKRNRGLGRCQFSIYNPA